MLKDKVNYPFGGGMSSITSGSGGPPSTDIYRRIVSGHFEIRQERRPRTVSFYVPLSKRTHESRHCAFEPRGARERDGEARRGNLCLSRGVEGIYPRARSARLGDDAVQSRQCTFEARGARERKGEA